MNRFSPESLRAGAEDSAERAKGRKPVPAKHASPALALDDAHGWTNPNDKADDAVLLAYGAIRPLKLVVAVELFQRIPIDLTGEELQQAVARREQIWRTVMRRARARRLYHIDDHLGRDEDVFCEGCLHGDPAREGSVVCRGAVDPPTPLAPIGAEERRDAADPSWFLSPANWLLLCQKCLGVYRAYRDPERSHEPAYLGWRVGYDCDPERVDLLWRNNRQLLTRDGAVMPAPPRGGGL